MQSDVPSAPTIGLRANLAPVMTLLVVTPFLTELLSNNMPPQVFFNPLVFLLLATAAYGFPVLLLREFACRYRLGLPGILCLGLIYGIINEGIFAKTFYLYDNVPVRTFDHYGYVAGISAPWALTISVWHAMHAFLAPLALVYYLFPAHAERPWITRGSAFWLAVPTAGFNALVFFTRSKQREPGQPEHFFLMVAVMALLLWLATKVPRATQLEGKERFNLKPLGAGVVSFLLTLLAPVLLSKAAVAPVWFYLYFAAVMGFAVWWMLGQATLALSTCLLFLVGNNLVTVGWAIPGAMGRGGVWQLLANVAFLVCFALFVKRLRAEGAGRDMAGLAAA